MALKKSQLYSSLWQSCDELRGGMDASQYKDYVLTLLFVKYVSDKYVTEPDSVIEVPDGGSFADMVKLKGDTEIGDKINKIIGRLAEANDLKGVIDQADFNDDSKLGSGKEMRERLSKLVAIFDDLNLHTNHAGGDDLLGDAYEYLMRHFATESGKSKGQFYTPAEVSRVMAQLVGIGAETRQDQTIYDPTCGSGSLLLKAADEAPRGITVYGQEMDNATWALARMNMILHGHPTAELWRGNTLAAPYFKNRDGGLRTFDFAVANPPFSAKAWSNGLNPKHDEFGRFKYGIPPAQKGDYAFLLHFISSLNSRGKGAIILPHGVLFRGSKESDIRRNLVRRGLIKGIIGLPVNLFYGTGIPACVLVIDKKNAHIRVGIFMIDASRGFVKEGNKNRLRAQDIHKIVDTFSRQLERPRYSRMVPSEEIANAVNDYNLNIRRYIDTSEPEDLHDLDAHLNGGIPNRDIYALNSYWTVFPSLRKALFQDSCRIGYSTISVNIQNVNSTILSHSEFKAFSGKVSEILDGWIKATSPILWDLDSNVSPKQVIHDISEDLLIRFKCIPPLDQYDVYQRLMDYWNETMQDDVYLVTTEGWQAGRRLRLASQKETPDFSTKQASKTFRYIGELIPGDLVLAKFFGSAWSNLKRGEAKIAEWTLRREEFEEEHCVDGGFLAGLEGKNGITKSNVQQRVMELKGAILNEYAPGTQQHEQAKSIKKTTFVASNWTQGIFDESGFFEELDILYSYLCIVEGESVRIKAYRQDQDILYKAVIKQYSELTDNEIRSLVVVDKWLARIKAAVESEVQKLTYVLAGRVRKLEERYAHTLPELEREIDILSPRVEEHLKKMGLSWV